MLNPVEHALNDISSLVSFRVEGLDAFSGWIVGNGRHSPTIDEKAARGG